MFLYWFCVDERWSADCIMKKKWVEGYCFNLLYYREHNDWMWYMIQWRWIILKCFSYSAKLVHRMKYQIWFFFSIYFPSSAVISKIHYTFTMRIQVHKHMIGTTCYTYFTSSLNRKLIRQLEMVKHIAATLLLFDQHACWLKHVWNRWRPVVIGLKAPGSICSAGISSTSCSSSEEGETIH